jgi:pimeloyl-ACP methyl ester carboxylesterase
MDPASTVTTPPAATIPDVTHHTAEVNGTRLHYVAAGDRGSPILLVHGFPETWWAFHRVIPRLAATHRVVAVDLRGFGDSSHAPGEYGSSVQASTVQASTVAAEDLHQLIGHLGLGPVHLTGQDISGGTVFRLAATRPGDVLSLTAIEMGLAGFGLEALADVTHGGAWHIGVLAAPGIPEMLLTGREREFLGQYAFRSMTAVAGSITPEDLDEFTRAYAQPDGFQGAIGLYRSMLSEGAELRELSGARRLRAPVLAIGAGGGPFTQATMAQVAAGEVRSVQLDGVGHYAALEAPAQVADAILAFTTPAAANRKPVLGQ